MNCSILAVTKAEYDNILQRFNVVTNEGITLGTEEITVETEADVEAALPKTATASYSDGSKAALNIKWDTDKINMNKAGTYTLTGSITPYSNPLIEQRADPQIKYDEEKDCYYFTASYPAFYSADNGYDRIVLRKADSIQELSDDNGGADKEITIWEAPDLGKWQDMYGLLSFRRLTANGTYSLLQEIQIISGQYVLMYLCARIMTTHTMQITGRLRTAVMKYMQLLVVTADTSRICRLI